MSPPNIKQKVPAIISNNKNNKPKPKISIITPSFNRVDEIDHLIDSINSQTLDHSLFEMIIADDGSTDKTEELVNKWKEKVDFDLRYISQENKGPGAARNLGMNIAKGELFLFIDSDCEADKNWAKNIYDKYVKEKFDACGGPDSTKADFTPLQRAIDFSMTSFLTTGGMRGHSTHPMAKFYPRSHNMGMTHALYEAVGGFGGLRHGQDIELSNRIIKSGAKVLFIPDAVVYHRRRTSIKRFFRQVFNWGVARVNLGKIDRKMLEPIHFVPSVVFLISVFIVVGFLVDPIEYGPIFELGFGLLLALSILGGIKQRSVTVAALLFVIIPVQIFGYGLGFLIAFIRRFIMGQGEWTGFRKRYYQ